MARNHLRDLMARLARGDPTARAELSRGLEPRLARIVRRVLAQGGRSRLARLIRAEAARQRGGELADRDALIQRIARRLCDVLLGRLPPGGWVGRDETRRE